MNISPKQLRIFLVLTETLNFSKTAEKMFMTQPSLSKAVRELENELGLSLFERSTRHVRITEGGKRLASIARTIVGEYDNGMKRLENSAEHESLQLTVAAWPSLAQVLVPAMCAILESRFKSPHIQVIDAPNSRCVESLIQYRADVALASISPAHPELHYKELMRDRFVILSGARWCGQIHGAVSMDDLIGMPVITLSDGSTAMRYMSAAYLRRGIEYEPKMQLEQISSVIGLVQAGVGIAVLPYLGVLPAIGMQGIQVNEITDGPLRSIGIVTRQSSNANALTEAAIEVAEELSQQLIAKYSNWILPPVVKRKKVKRS